jgi:hypothetical protein
VVDAVNQVAKTASQVETLMAKNQQQQQVEKDAQRMVDLAQARMNAGILPARASAWRSCRRCRSASPRCACTASGLMPAFS